jgi:hypothetical protein
MRSGRGPGCILLVSSRMNEIIRDLCGPAPGSATIACGLVKRCWRRRQCAFVGFVWHVRGERATHARRDLGPAVVQAREGRNRQRAGRGQARTTRCRRWPAATSMPAVVAIPARMERLATELRPWHGTRTSPSTSRRRFRSLTAMRYRRPAGAPQRTARGTRIDAARAGQRRRGSAH